MAEGLRLPPCCWGGWGRGSALGTQAAPGEAVKNQERLRFGGQFNPGGGKERTHGQVGGSAGTSRGTHCPAATPVHCVWDSTAGASAGSDHGRTQPRARPPAGPTPRPAACLSSPRTCWGRGDAGEPQDGPQATKTAHRETCRSQDIKALHHCGTSPGQRQVFLGSRRIQPLGQTGGQRMPTSTSPNSGARSWPREKPHPSRTHRELWPSPTGCPLSACPGLSAPCWDLGITLLAGGAHSGAGRGRGEYRSGKPCAGGKGGTAISLEQDPCGPQLGARRESRRHTLCGCSLGPREARGTGTESAWRVTAAGSSRLLRPHSAGASPCLPPSAPCSGGPDNCGIPPHSSSHSSLASRRRLSLPAVTGTLGTADPSLPDPGFSPGPAGPLGKPRGDPGSRSR